MNDLTSTIFIGPGFTGTPQAATFRDTEGWFFDAISSASSSDSGEHVSPATALTHVPLWQAVNILAGDVGQIPWHKMLRDSAGMVDKDRKHPIEWVLSEQPNRYQTPSTWRETVMSHALLWGNSLSYITRESGEWELLPLSPDRVTAQSDEKMGYVVRYMTDAGPLYFMPWELFHVRGLATDGYWGLSAVAVLKNAIGHGLALQRHGNRVFKNGAKPSGALKNPGKMPSTEAMAELRRQFESVHSGADNTGKVLMLWGGTEWQTLSMSNEDAEWIEARRLDRQIIASVFNLPAFKLNSLENSSVAANVEEQSRLYFITTLSRWFNKFNEEAKRKLLSVRERRSGEHFFRWFPEAFLRGDIQTRYTAYSQAIQARFMSPNEVREREDMNPYDGGDEFMNPAIDTAAGADSSGDNSQDQDADESTADNATAQNLAQRLIAKEAAVMLDVEANRVEKAGKTAKNFVAWMADFYENYAVLGEKYLALPCEIAAEAGLSGVDWRRACERRALANQQRLLSLADCATKDTIAASVAALCEDFRGESEHFTRMILGADNG